MKYNDSYRYERIEGCLQCKLFWRLLIKVTLTLILTLTLTLTLIPTISLTLIPTLTVGCVVFVSVDHRRDVEGHCIAPHLSVLPG